MSLSYDNYLFWDVHGYTYNEICIIAPIVILNAYKNGFGGIITNHGHNNGQVLKNFVKYELKTLMRSFTSFFSIKIKSNHRNNPGRSRISFVKHQELN